MIRAGCFLFAFHAALTVIVVAIGWVRGGWAGALLAWVAESSLVGAMTGIILWWHGWRKPVVGWHFTEDQGWVEGEDGC